RLTPTIITAKKGIYNTNLPNLHNDNMVAFLLAITTASYPSNLAQIDLSLYKLMDNGVLLTIKNPKEHKISLAHAEINPIQSRFL
ncbi:33623_t:CDS:2, partial [Gigaspora margarita]